MSAEDVTQFFIREMRVFFGDPPGDDPKGALIVYQRRLSRFTPEVLRRTAEHFQTTQKRRTWPMPADVIEHAIRIESELSYEAHKQKAASAPPRPTEQQIEHNARAAIMSPLGQTAAREGWVAALFDFWRENNRAPDGSEIKDLKVAVAKSRASYEELCASPEKSELTRSLIKLGDGMLERERTFAAQVLAGTERPEGRVA